MLFTLTPYHLPGHVGLGLPPVVHSSQNPAPKNLAQLGEAIFSARLPDIQVTGVPDNAEVSRTNDAITVRVKQRFPNAYMAEIKTGKNLIPIKKGDVVFVQARLSCLQSKHESGEGMFSSFLQLSGPPWNSQVMIEGTVPNREKTFYYAAKATQDYPVGTGEFTFHIGGQAQTLVLKELTVRNLGPNADMSRLPRNRIEYAWMAPDAPWRKTADQNIEKYRKSNLTITVVDGGGKPVPGAQVRVRLLRHQYEFGSFIEDPLLGVDVDSDKYRATFKKYFNKATVPMYWADWGWETRKSDYLRNAEWMQKNGIPTKAHVLLYPGAQFMPAKANALRNNPAALRKMIDDHIREILDETRRFDFVSWDILNETRDLTDLPPILGDSFYSDVYKLAHSINPKPLFFYNENSILEGGGQNEVTLKQFEGVVTKLLREGAPVEGLGLQGHFGETFTSPTQIWRVLDRLAAFKLPIQTTEFDIATRDEGAQAAYTRDYYTAFFAHPSTTGITQWGFWEKAMWQPYGAMFRTDWSPKPNALAFYDLVYKKWWSDVTVTTNAQGQATVRVFKGRHRMELSLGSKKGKYDIVVSIDSKTRAAIK